MWRKTALIAILAGCALAWNHHDLNGTWQLIPERSEFHGEPAIQTGSVTIDDREGNIYVSRNFNYDAADRSTSTTFDTDARAKTSIKEPGIKSKTEWKGDVLQVTTTRDGYTTVERYKLLEDGTMVLTVDRPSHATETLFFRR
jgi:hypothetical protein